MQTFTNEDVEFRRRETRKITARLYENPDYQEWLTRSLRPKLELLRANVMRQDLLSEEGRQIAATSQIEYNALYKHLEQDLQEATKAESAYRETIKT